MDKNKKIYVTQPYLPPLNEFNQYLETIWKNKWLTNNGNLHKDLENELANFLEVPFVSLFSNGTLALLTALQALDIKGEVITTPYTFVATSNALVWNNIKPVFVDIEPIFCNIDANKIEYAITNKTTAIMPVHVYGNPCNQKAINTIAQKHNLKIIYDAAHAFGVKENGQSILNYGNLSVLSFHATKIFNTFEGGAIISHNIKMKQHIDNLKNFGFRGETEVILPGINGKMNEVQAAMGLTQLRHIDYIIRKRRAIYNRYCSALSHIPGISFITPKDNVDFNASYFPIFIDNNYRMNRDELYFALRKQNIYARRYFYPLLTNFKAYDNLNQTIDLSTAKKKSDQVLCLPIYPDLEFDEVDLIINLIKTI